MTVKNRNLESYRNRKTYKNRAENSGIFNFFLTMGGFILGLFFFFSIIILIFYLHNKKKKKDDKEIKEDKN